MQVLAFETLAEIAALAASSSSPEEYEASVIALVDNKDLARRALDWLPEAFGIVLITHMELDITLPKSFMARNLSGAWIEFPLARDPIFGDSVKLATIVYRNGPRAVFSALATASSVISVVNKALDSGTSLAGGVMEPIRMFGLSAEAYGLA